MEELRKLEEEEIRKKKIEELIESVPYKPVIDKIEKDTNRLQQGTVSSTAEPYNEYDLFKVNGYNDEEIFKDQRFRLIMALRQAGLQNSEYGRNMVMNLPASHNRKLFE